MGGVGTPGAARTLRLCHLYPAELNLYGDRGNVLALTRRAAWRGMSVEVLRAGPGDAVDFRQVDLLCIGGGEDRHQAAVAADLARRAEALRAAVEDGLPVLAVCGGYQLLGRYYQPAGAPRLEGAGVFDAYTEAAAGRLVGNVVADSPWGVLVGFENHSGRTYLGPGCRPLGRVRPGRGAGNNGVDGGEGAVRGACVGTYLHGSFLPRNPAVADFLLRAAVARRYGSEAAAAAMRPLDDALEERARRAAVRRGRRGRR